MADLDPEQLREITNLAQQAEVKFREMERAINDAARGQVDLADQARIAVTRQSELADIAKKISQFTEKDFQSKQKQAAFFREIDKLQTRRTTLERQLVALEGLMVNATGNQLQALSRIAVHLVDSLQATEDLYKNAVLIERKFREIDRSSSWIEGLSNLTRSIPLIGPAIEDIATSWRKASGYLNENKSNLEKTGIVLKSLSTIIVAGVIRNVFKLNNDIVEFARNTETTTKVAEKTTAGYRDLARQVKGLTETDLKGYAAAFSKELGVAGALSADLAKTGAILTKRFGLTNDQAAKLQKLTFATGQDFEKFTEGIIGSVEAQNALNKTAFSTNEIFQSISNLGAANTVSIGRFKNGLVDAAIEAKKLGTTLKGIEGIQETLLNFEQSIAAELEAELLTGRQINLERARYYAVTNDLEGLTREIANNVGSLAEFQEMNYFAQVSTAKVYGMQRDQLAEMLMQQEALEGIRASGFKSEKDYTEALQKELKLAKTKEDRERVMAEFTEKAGTAELANRIAQQSAQERLAELQEKIATSMVEKVLPALEKLIDNIERFLKFVGGGDAGQGIERTGYGLGGIAIGGLAVKGAQMAKKGVEFAKRKFTPTTPATPAGPPTAAPPTVTPPTAPAPHYTTTTTTTAPAPRPTPAPAGRWTWSQKLGRYQFRDAATGRLMSASGAPPMPKPPSTGMFSRILSKLRGGGGGKAALITTGLMLGGSLFAGATGTEPESEEEALKAKFSSPEKYNRYLEDVRKSKDPSLSKKDRDMYARFAQQGLKFGQPTTGTADPYLAPFELLFKLYDVLTKVDTSNREVAKTVTEQTSYRYAVEGL